jgi:hypothetical protein
MSDEDMQTLEDTLNTMAISVNQTPNSDDRIKAIVNALDAFLSEKNLNQKSRLSIKQIMFSTRTNTVNNHMFNKYGVKNRVIEKLDVEMIEKMISLKGEGRNEAIKLINLLNERMAEDKVIQTKDVQVR